MIVAIRTTKIETIKRQLLPLLHVTEKDIDVTRTRYGGITVIRLLQVQVPKINTIRNIEALLLDESASEELLQPTMDHAASYFKSLECVDEREQYEHLSQLLHIQKATRDKR